VTLGLPPTAPQLLRSHTNLTGTVITLTFDQIMADPAGKQGQFSATVNGEPRNFIAAALHPDNPAQIDLTLTDRIYLGDQVTVSYTAGDVASSEGGLLGSFTGQAVVNFVPGKRLIAGGDGHSLALLADGTVIAWGDNNRSQCNVPAGLTNVVAIAKGDYHSMALKSDGTVVAWGYNGKKQSNVPADLTNVSAVAAGEGYSMALKADGTIVAWGADAFNAPSGLKDVVAMDANGNQSLMLKADGTVVTGRNNNNGDIPLDLSDVIAVAAGGAHSLALKSDGTVVAWGHNNKGQCRVPEGLKNVVAIAAGGYHSMALKSDGTVVVWGDNSWGQCNVPAGLTNVVAIAAGWFHNLALKSDGSVVAWGDNRIGQCSVPEGLNLSGRLSSLETSQANMTPSFQPDTMAYTIYIGQTNPVEITATLEDSLNRLNINGQPAVSGESMMVTLGDEQSEILITVSTPDIRPGWGLTRTYTLSINREANNVSVAASPPEGGTVSGGGVYIEGVAVTVTATPLPGYKFVNWTENGEVVSEDPSYQFTMGTVDRTLVAHFAALPVHFGGGSGTSADPFIIMNADHLNNVRLYLDTPGLCFKLGADINLDVSPYNTGAGWEPIGTMASPFQGTLLGNRKTISGLKINRTGSDGVGLFCLIDSATIQDLRLENVSVSGRDYTGGLTGISSNSTIARCYISGSVAGNSFVGGLVGGNSGTVTDSQAACTVTGTADQTLVGGLVGGNQNGTITRCSATGSVTGVAVIGGLAGGNQGGNITSCYATGAVRGSGNFTGGLVGVNSEGEVADSYATGSVQGDVAYTGGLVGWCDNGTITNSYATGAVTGGSYKGGLVGVQDNSSSTNSFWDTQTSGLQTSALGTSRTTAQMKQQTTFSPVSWDFNNTWAIVDGATYPYLQWQTTGIDQARPVATFTPADGASDLPVSVIPVISFDEPVYNIDGSEITTANIGSLVTLSEGGESGTAVAFSAAINDEKTQITVTPLSALGYGRTYRLAVAPVADAAGNRTTASSAAFTTKDTPILPSIATQPISQTVTEGQTVIFTVVATGDEPFNYQWKKNNLDLTDDDRISGATTATLTISNAQVSDAGNYTCYVSNPAGNAMSETATLTVTPPNTPPTAKTPLPDLIVGEGASATFTADDIAEDADGDPLIITAIVSGPDIENATASLTDGTVSVTGVSAGNTSVEVAVSDGTDTVNINVQIIVTEFAGGDGSEDNPYLIANAHQLNNVRNHLNSHFKLVNDIDLSDYLSEDGEGYNEGQGWQPIGKYGNGRYFTGKFDGNNHTITGLYINRPTEEYVGLFGYTRGADIQNVKLVGVNITGMEGVGSLVGWNRADIKDCSATGKVQGEITIGGLIGGNCGTVENCSFSGTVTGTDTVMGNVGGLIAYHFQDSSAVGSIFMSCATGTVTGALDVGGLVGTNDGGVISNSYSTCVVNGDEFSTGGLVGYNYSGHIYNSYAVGKVSGNGYVGGLVGEYDNTVYDGGSITDSYYNQQVAGQVPGVGLGNGEGVKGLTITAMKQQSAFEGWDFTNIWRIDEDATYPYFTWQNEPLMSITVAPTITTHPISQTITEGQSVTFTVVAAGDEPLSYQWKKDGDNLTDGGSISGATTATLTISNAQASDAGSYTVVVTNAAGSVTSDSATLTVNPAPIISATISPETADFDKNLANQADVDTAITWNSATAVTDVKNAGVSIGTENYAVSEDILTIKKEYLAIQPVGSLILTIEFDKGDAAVLTINISDTTVPKYTVTYDGNGGTGTAPTESDKAAGETFTAADNTFVAPSGKQFKEWNTKADGTGESYQPGETITMPGSDLTLYAIWEDIPVSPSINPASVNFDLAAPADVFTIISWGSHATSVTGVVYGSESLTPGEDYTIVSNKLILYQEYLSGLNLTEGDTVELDIIFNDSSVLTLTVNVVSSHIPVAPTITTHPISQTITEGQSVTFTVVATGDEPLSYQWKKDGDNLTDGGRISGATTATLTISNAQASDAGSYTVVVTNAAGSVTSDAATLTVNAAPPANNSPAPKNPVPTQSVTAGSTTTFNATDIAEDADNDPLTIMTIVTGPDTAKATASLDSGTVTLTGVAAGDTSVVVAVSDGMDTVNVTVPITVTAAPPITYTVSFDSQGGSSVASITGVSSGSVITAPLAPTRPGYTFGGWYKEASCVNAWNFSTDTVNGNITLYAKWTYSGGGSGGGSSTPVIPTYKATVSGISTPETSLPVSVNTKTGNAAIDLGTLAKDIFAGTGTVVLTVPAIPGASSYTLTIPAASLSDAQGEGVLTFSTSAGSVTIPSGMLAGMPGTEGKQAGITIAQGDKSSLPEDVQDAIGDRPLIQLTLTLDGAQTDWNNPSAPVTVSIPYTPTAAELADPEHIVVWYIDGSGNVISVPNGRYDPATGTVTFTTTHFSHYAVAYVHKTFGDLGGVEWARKPIEVMASKGIITGTGANSFSPAANITRADYLVLLIKTLGLTAEFDGNFDDVEPGAYYYEAVGIAKKLGIAAGSGNNRFNPRENISRQDMMVLTARALEKYKGLKVAGGSAVLDKFSDKGDIAGYAVNSLSTLVKEGLIAGFGDRLNPRTNTTRAEAAVFLYRIYNKY
jgi:uncharacterized repeat protein (TIGR02543 family)